MDLPDPLVPGDEHRHSPDPDDRLWNESWYLDWANDDASLAGYLRWSLYPGLGVAWFWACLVGEGRPLVTAVKHDLAPPDDAHTLDVQSEGIRCEMRVDREFETVSVRYEAGATVHDEPASVFGGADGKPAVLGAELTWETAGGVYPYPGVSRYEVPCTVHGNVWVDGERHGVDTHGERDHSWGHRDWWSFGWVWTSGRLGDGTAFHATEVRIPGVDYTPGFVVPSGGSLRTIEGFAADEEIGPAGLPASASMRLDDVALAVAPVAHAPVRMEDPDGRTGHLQRALCRFETGDGRSGTGWTEWNQPPDPGDGGG